MKGIVLGGGTGSRLAPLTKADNKHLLPVYNKRMIEYPIRTLVNMGIKDIILITGGQRPGAFLELLRNGKDFGIEKLYYTYQEGNGGIADALAHAQPFLEPNESCIVILGDNYFEIPPLFSEHHAIIPTGSVVLLKKTETPWHFGIAEIADSGHIISVEEKPSEPKSDLAILGAYFFDYTVWEKLEKVSPSDRGELEITDILRLYMEEKNLYYMPYDHYWSDMGTFDSWMEVSKRIASK